MIATPLRVSAAAAITPASFRLANAKLLDAPALKLPGHPAGFPN